MHRIFILGLFAFSACCMVTAAMMSMASTKSGAARKVRRWRTTESSSRILHKRHIGHIVGTTVAQWQDVFDEALIRNLPAVKYYVEVKNFSLSQTNEDGETLAHIAAKEYNLVMLQYLLRKQPSLVEVKDKWDQTVLAIAIKIGDDYTVRYLVDDLKADIYHPRHQRFGNMAIHIAAAAGQLDMLKYFVEEKKVDVDCRSFLKEPPVFLAAENVRIRNLKYLVERRNATVTALGPDKENILFVSAKKGDLKVPRYLLDERKIPFDINWQDVFGRTVVYIAARYNHLNFIKYCVEEKGADIHIANNRGWTPLFEAANDTHPQVFAYLVQKGADIDHRDNANQTLEKVAVEAPIILTLANRTRYERNQRCVTQTTESE